MLNSGHQATHLIIINTQFEDISKIVDLQKQSFHYLARYGNIWRREELTSPLIFSPKDNSLLLNQMAQSLVLQAL
jgi:hypothetical protein